MNCYIQQPLEKFHIAFLYLFLLHCVWLSHFFVQVHTAYCQVVLRNTFYFQNFGAFECICTILSWHMDMNGILSCLSNFITMIPLHSAAASFLNSASNGICFIFMYSVTTTLCVCVCVQTHTNNPTISGRTIENHENIRTSNYSKLFLQ